MRCSPIQSNDAVTAPGTEPVHRLWLRAAPTRNSSVSTVVFTRTVINVIGQRYDDTDSPSTSVLAASVERTEIASTATPAVSSRKRLLSRSRIGFGRLFRGTDQATCIAFWMAVPSPSDPYRAVSAPTTTPAVDP